MRRKVIVPAIITSIALLGASTAAAHPLGYCIYAHGRKAVCPAPPRPSSSHQPFSLQAAERSASSFEHRSFAGSHLDLHVVGCHWRHANRVAACTVDVPHVVLVTNTLPVHIEWTDIVRRGWRDLTVRSVDLRQIS